MTKEEFDEAVKGTTEERDCQFRKVSNGYVIVATRRWVNDGTGTTKFGLTLEGVAQDENLLLMAMEQFVRFGRLAAVQ